MSKKIKISDLKPDDKNANKHSHYGMSLLERGIKRNGLGRSILISADDEIIAGNGVTEVAGTLGIKNVRVVETDGTEIIAVKRIDIKSGTKKFHDMALSDNGISKQNIVIDIEVVEVICEEFDINAQECGIEKNNSRMLNNSNFHTKNNYDGESIETELYPITILQTKKEYELFSEIKNKLRIDSSMQAFSKIIELVINII